MRKAVTLQQVADAAGVSINTASRAIRADRHVSPEARARVQQAVEQLRYRPNAVARTMRGNKSRLLGVFVNAIGWAVVHELVDYISEEARRLDYDLVIFSADTFHDARRLGTSDLLNSLCDGMLMLLPRQEDSFIEVLERARSNCVVIGFAARELALPVVVTDNHAGGRIATEHLLELGHRRIAYIQGSNSTGQSGQREAGYRAALEAAGIAPDPALVRLGNFEQAGVIRAIDEWMALSDPPTAIFAANDGMAINAIETLQERGLEVPEDISVVGFDDIQLARLVHPKLTTIRQPSREMAVRAVHRVLAMIDSGQFESGREAFLPELVVRQSTGPLTRR